MHARRTLLALAAGLALADASVVTLALPQLLHDFDTTVMGVAFVLGVYAAVLAATLLPAEWASRQLGPARVGAIGFTLFGLASLGAALSGSLGALLVARAVQAAGGGAGLVAAFTLLRAGGEAPRERRLWLAVSVLSTALGPALGGALTQAFAWQSIFYAQAPFALLAAWVCFAAEDEGAPAGERFGRVRGTGDDGAAGAGASGGATSAARTSGGAAGAGASGAATSAARTSGGAAGAGASGAATSAASTSGGVAGASGGGAPRGGALRERWPGGVVPAIALACVSAALTAVLFLLVLLLVAGWSVSPLRAAATVSVLPAAALAGGFVRGDARLRAAAGCLLVGAGTVALAYLPDARLAWTFAPQVLAGLGMGLALPALAGELLPERDALDAARGLTVRHVGIVIALLGVAPVISHSLGNAVFDAREQGVALVLDARLPPEDKVSLAPDLLKGVDAEQPRAALQQALAEHRTDYDPGTQDRTAFDAMARQADLTVVSAVGDAFFGAFLITGALAIVGGALLAAGGIRRPVAAIGAIVAGAAVVSVTARAHADKAPEKVHILQNTCNGRSLPDTGGLTGVLQDAALKVLDREACHYDATREEYVLALADKDDAERFEEKHGKDPRSAGGLLSGLFG